jgi:hypothetical protein
LAKTGQVFGVSGSSNSTTTNSAGVAGVENATTGQVTGVAGNTNSTGNDAAGVNGFEGGATGQVYGVAGGTNSTTNFAAGVNGFEGATTGVVFGVAGGTASTTNGAAAVSGFESAATGEVVGVSGGTNSATNGAAGVSGYEGATTGNGFGVIGQSASTGGVGVQGVNNASSGGTAVAAFATATTGPAQGVYGQTASTSGNGVVGNAIATSGTPFGVQGFSASASGTGIQSVNYATGGVVALSGPSPYLINAYAGKVGAFTVDDSGNGYFGGNLSVTGKLTKGSGSFKIDHPLDPANKYLSHSFVESPDMMNVYNGVIVLDAHGSAWVTLPDYFEALNRDFRYQLTAVGTPGPNLYIAKEVSGNRFRIAGGRAKARVSWQATGICQDAYANANRIPVEEQKAPQERGRYLHPELFGASEQQAIGGGLPTLSTGSASPTSAALVSPLSEAGETAK